MTPTWSATWTGTTMVISTMRTNSPPRSQSPPTEPTPSSGTCPRARHLTRPLPASGWAANKTAVESPIGPAIDGEVEDHTVPGYPPATLTLVKAASPADSTAFPFSHDIDNSGDFNLADGESKQFTNLAVGLYKISELVPAGWRLNDISCVGNATAAVVNNPTVQVTLEQGEDVTCTFTNEGLSKIIVTKQTLPDGAPQLFDFSLTGRPDFLLGDGDSSETPYLSAGTYTDQRRYSGPAGLDSGRHQLCVKCDHEQFHQRPGHRRRRDHAGRRRHHDLHL